MDDDLLIFWRNEKYGGISALVYDTAGNELHYFEDYTYLSILYHNGVFRTVEKEGNTVKYVKP